MYCSSTPTARLLSIIRTRGLHVAALRSLRISGVSLCNNYLQLSRNPRAIGKSRELHRASPEGPSYSSLVSLEDEFNIPTVPDFIELKDCQRLVAIGDVHGDLEKLRQFLEIAGVLDPGSSLENPLWSGGDTICVQCGDVLDRGDKELACWRLLADLARQAPLHRGALAFLFGNHEALNMKGMFHYTMDRSNKDFEREIGSSLDAIVGTDNWRDRFGGNQPARWVSMEPGGLLAKPFSSKMKVAIMVGKTLLVHGGLTKPHLDYYGGIVEMNRVARGWMLQREVLEQKRTHHDSEKEKPAGDAPNSAQSLADAISRSMPDVLGGSSPVWIRLFSHPSNSPPRNPLAQSMLDHVLSKVGADRMVVGHTPQNRINAALRGKVWRVDVGASKGMTDGTPEVLEVVRDTLSGNEEVWILTGSECLPAFERWTIEPHFTDWYW